MSALVNIDRYLGIDHMTNVWQAGFIGDIQNSAHSWIIHKMKIWWAWRFKASGPGQVKSLWRVKLGPKQGCWNYSRVWCHYPWTERDEVLEGPQCMHPCSTSLLLGKVAAYLTSEGTGLSMTLGGQLTGRALNTCVMSLSSSSHFTMRSVWVENDSFEEMMGMTVIVEAAEDHSSVQQTSGSIWKMWMMGRHQTHLPNIYNKVGAGSFLCLQTGLSLVFTDTIQHCPCVPSSPTSNPSVIQHFCISLTLSTCYPHWSHYLCQTNEWLMFPFHFICIHSFPVTFYGHQRAPYNTQISTI